jgi:hypothetical protein
MTHVPPLGGYPWQGSNWQSIFNRTNSLSHGARTIFGYQQLDRLLIGQHHIPPLASGAYLLGLPLLVQLQ